MVVGPRIHLGAHARNLNIVFRAPRNEPEPALILLRQMAVMIALAWQRKKKFAPHKQKDAKV